MIKHHLLVIFIFIIITACHSNQDQNAGRGKVYVEKTDGGFELIKDGKPFFIKGAAGSSNFSVLKEAGGNTIRTWDTTNLKSILDSAQANQLCVIVGLPFPNHDQSGFFSNKQKVINQFKAYKSIVNRFKNHPSLLMWAIGNELYFPYKPNYYRFYNSFNELTDMIHHDDPDHPVTTVILDFNKKCIVNIKMRCNIDLISFNIYSSIYTFRQDLKDFSWFWDGPFMLSEWGVDGPWKGSEQTAWGAYIERTSKSKADLLLNRYKSYMPLEDSRFLGSCVFYWGNKQEGTHTWFSLFDKNGHQSEPVGILRYLWTGTVPRSYPDIRYMLLNNKGARDNILTSPNETCMAEVKMNSFGKVKSYKWQIFKEDWYRENNVANTRELVPLENLNKNTREFKVNFRAPYGEGPYRIFVTVYDNHGNFATANTPFYVVDSDEKE